MRTHVLKGSKQQIADDLIQLSGEVREAIVFVEEASHQDQAPAAEAEDIFAEMQPYMVDVPDADDSREAIYSPVGDE